MTMSTGIFGWPVRMLTVAALIGIIGLIAVHDSPTALAAGGSWVHSCPAPIIEGESGTVGVGANFGNDEYYDEWIYTYSNTAKSRVDFVKHFKTRFRFYSSPGYFDIETLEDDIPEGDETFWVNWWSGYVLRECPVTIIDDDPQITGIEMVSKPLSRDTYGPGETIEFAATFNAEVEVRGSALIGVYIGDRWDGAWYQRGSGTDTLVFGYVVKPEDLDENGVSVHNGYVDRNGRQHGFGGNANIVGKGTDVPAYPWYDGITDQPDHKIDGFPTPFVTDMQIVSQPRNGTLYREGEIISVEATFSSPVRVEGNPGLRLKLDDNVGYQYRVADADLTVGREVVFRYEVTKGDMDHNGVSIGGIVLLHGSIKGDIEDRDIPAWEYYEDQPDLAGHKVDGRDYVKAVRITSNPEEGDTYGIGEVITVALQFNDEVSIQWTGHRIRLQVGSPTPGDSGIREARYDSGTFTDTVVFRYTVQEGDRDTDGLSVVPGSDDYGFGPGKQFISSANATPRVDHKYPGLDNAAGHKVDGVRPSVSSVEMDSDPGADYTYALGDVIMATVTFSEDVTVIGTPQLELDLGGAAKTASYYKTYGEIVVFSYTVAVGDVDADGIAIGANKLNLNGGAIQDAAGNDATLTHDAVPADTGHQVSAPGGL